MMLLAVAAGCDTTAYHVDHGLREGSDQESEVVSQACLQFGVRFVPLRVECAPGPNLEARARAARFAALPKGVATGHTADDQAETILINLLRGAGSDGLRGMIAGPRHPILGLRRRETRALVASLGLEIVNDPTNDDPKYLRNRVRHELLPLADDIARRDVTPVLARQSELIADETALLDELASAIDPTDVAALRTQPTALARRALRAWLRGIIDPPYAPDATTLERVLRVANGEAKACEIGGGLRIRRSKGRLSIEGTRVPAPASAERNEVAE